MKSFSEIETISKRASRGAGFSWGVSEEIGKSVRLMEMFGLPGILYLTSYLNQIGNHNYQKMTIISADNISNNIPYCPISVGVNFMDQVYNLEKIEKINFSNLAYPLLTVPFLSRSSEVVGKKVLLNLESFKFLFNFNHSIFSNFDNSLTRAAANMGADPVKTFFKIQMPLILPGVISGGLFAFITSFDEVVVVMFVGSTNQKTLPWQMFTGLREQISPTILAVATILVAISIALLVTLELLRRRSERLRGLSPG